ncbi:hypothetical protein MRB53_003564 [Persea americana]|uniref:Uncharacterized protein n=1 Tax=Persea americana TaxID=3435 RepID=A0ACC2MYS3_PERAE|nr:hypothetical protein MRB53_003564 [Persea americana]
MSATRRQTTNEDANHWGQITCIGLGDRVKPQIILCWCGRQIFNFYEPLATMSYDAGLSSRKISGLRVI